MLFLFYFFFCQVAKETKRLFFCLETKEAKVQGFRPKS